VILFLARRRLQFRPGTMSGQKILLRPATRDVDSFGPVRVQRATLLYPQHWYNTRRQRVHRTRPESQKFSHASYFSTNTNTAVRASALYCTLGSTTAMSNTYIVSVEVYWNTSIVKKEQTRRTDERVSIEPTKPSAESHSGKIAVLFSEVVGARKNL
jgi:hypothetical protein